MSSLDDKGREGARPPGAPPSEDIAPPSGKALRFAIIAFGICVGSGLVTAVMMRYVTHELTGMGPAPLAATAAVAAPVAPVSHKPRVSNALTYAADGSGHFFIDGSINGAPVHFLLDTGATFVSLSPEDAAAAGISAGSLQFTEATNTANGVAHVARTSLRSVRLGQLEVTDVTAMVMDKPMPFSLLGMSFLSRVDGYSIRDGVLTIEW